MCCSNQPRIGNRARGQFGYVLLKPAEPYCSLRSMTQTKLPLPASKNVSFSPRLATLLFLAPCFLTRRRRCWGWAGPPRQVSTRPTGKLSAYEPAPPMLAAVAPPMLAAAVAPLFFSGSAHCSHRYERARRLACCPQKAEKVSILPRPKGICDRHAKP